jgi:hypothetical protein
MRKRTPTVPIYSPSRPAASATVRFNDFIFPVAMPLEAAYGAVIHSDVPVVVQFTRQATQRCPEALLGTLAYPAPD